MAYKVQRYGWIGDLPDVRDHLWSAPEEVRRWLPAAADLRPQCPPVWDQGALGSAAAHAIAAAVQFERRRHDLADAAPSRLFLYYNQRLGVGTAESDSGAQLRCGIKSIAAVGHCFERDWSYDPRRFAHRPPGSCYKQAIRYRTVRYNRLLPDLANLKGCLAQGRPFVFGFAVYPAFESGDMAKGGDLPMPGMGERVIAGHAAMAVGYDDSRQRFIVRNSWGKDWGQEGYFTMPYAYLASPSLADDFWTMRLAPN
jgi:C1A family cysteine protease